MPPQLNKISYSINGDDNSMATDVMQFKQAVREAKSEHKITVMMMTMLIILITVIIQSTLGIMIKIVNVNAVRQMKIQILIIIWKLSSQEMKAKETWLWYAIFCFLRFKV